MSKVSGVVFVVVIVLVVVIIFLTVRSCLLLTLNKCLKGQKSLGSHFECVFPKVGKHQIKTALKKKTSVLTKFLMSLTLNLFFTLFFVVVKIQFVSSFYNGLPTMCQCPLQVSSSMSLTFHLFLSLFFLVRSCALITMIRCLKGHTSLGQLFECVL